MAENQIAYIELPTTDIHKLRTFYAELFGWTYLDLGDDYSVFQNQGIDGGLNPNSQDRTKAPLVLVETGDVDAMEERVRSAGATITMPCFDYPGGRRFHFVDPSGNEIGVFQNLPR